MSVWLTIPSKRSPEEAERVLSKWREMGYRVAIQRDGDEVYNSCLVHNLLFWRPYQGYAEAVNFLVANVLHLDATAEWFIAVGDDTLPDPNKRADEIAMECGFHFGAIHGKVEGDYLLQSTFGVMQPTGDPWEDNGPRGDGTGEKRLIRRVAGSPWLGREWCLRANKGKGPLWPNFFHMFADETLQCVAQKLGVFWQRDDLTHHHDHWGRPKPGERIGHISNMPEFLKQANSEEEWRKSKAEFERLKAGGFEECLPL